MKICLPLKTLFQRVFESPVRSRKKYKRKNLEVFAYDCKVSSVIPELAKIKFMGKKEKEMLPNLNNSYAKHLTEPNCFTGQRHTGEYLVH